MEVLSQHVHDVHALAAGRIVGQGEMQGSASVDALISGSQEYAPVLFIGTI